MIYVILRNLTKYVSHMDLLTSRAASDHFKITQLRVTITVKNLNIPKEYILDLPREPKHLDNLGRDGEVRRENFTNLPTTAAILNCRPTLCMNVRL